MTQHRFTYDWTYRCTPTGAGWLVEIYTPDKSLFESATFPDMGSAVGAALDRVRELRTYKYDQVERKRVEKDGVKRRDIQTE